MSASLMHIKVGDPVVLVREYMREPAVTRKVVKVGRKYLYVEGDRSGYYREDGAGDESAWRSYVRTPEAHEHIERVEAARRELWTFGIRVERSISSAVLLEIREALINIVPRAVPPSRDSKTEKSQ